MWLGNSRANPPRLHMLPSKQGAAYWHYSINELGMEDVAAQVPPPSPPLKAPRIKHPSQPAWGGASDELGVRHISAAPLSRPEAFWLRFLAPADLVQAQLRS